MTRFEKGCAAAREELTNMSFYDIIKDIGTFGEAPAENDFQRGYLYALIVEAFYHERLQP